ncbi:Transcription repressor [Nymphaea thermarum]|nr:Transcription repressor [Nymphaea thermarum]
MGKGLKLRISRVIPSFLSCRSKEAYSVPESPAPLVPTPGFGSSPGSDDFVPTFPRAASLSPKQRSCFGVSQFRAAGEPRGRPDVKFFHDLDLLVVEDAGFRWKKEENWHVVSREDQTVRRKISISLSDKGDVCPPASPASPQNSSFMAHERRARSRGRGQRRKASSRAQRRSNSSADSGWFSSEEDETETLFSSKSFSSDSSDFFQNQLLTIQESPCGIKRSSGRRKPAKPRRGTARPASSPALTSGFRRILPWAFDGKVKESFAVVKRSRDPYHDFMKSMMEMITEKELFDARDLEQLLRCFLSLNAPHHHDVIVRVFSDVWDALFSNASPLE